MTDSSGDPTLDLRSFLDASPSPYHVVESAVTRLAAHGFEPLDERDDWAGTTGRRYVVRGGSIVAWVADRAGSVRHGFRIVGAHTDSPNLRLKPRADISRLGYRQVGVEVYGGALWNSWLDRDLGVSGRVAVHGAGADASAVQMRLVHLDRPLLRIPQLAIHLDRGVNDNGLKLNPQQHLVPVLGLGSTDQGGITRLVAEAMGVSIQNILTADLMLHDLSPARRLGVANELLSSARLDNQVSCWAAIESLGHTVDAEDEPPGVPVVCLFDHEEVGSESATGAAGIMLPTILERIVAAGGGGRDDWFRSLASSRCVSADGAHATHPNYPERHDPEHPVQLNGGPVIKANANVRYATDAPSSAWFELLCRRAGVDTQPFVSRNDMSCGSTIGAITAARLGISTVDVGIAQLSMHSARELCGVTDPGRFVRVLDQFLLT